MPRLSAAMICKLIRNSTLLLRRGGINAALVCLAAYDTRKNRRSPRISNPKLAGGAWPRPYNACWKPQHQRPTGGRDESRPYSYQNLSPTWIHPRSRLTFLPYAHMKAEGRCLTLGGLRCNCNSHPIPPDRVKRGQNTGFLRAKPLSGIPKGEALWPIGVQGEGGAFPLPAGAPVPAPYRLSSTSFQSRAAMRSYSSGVMVRMVPCLNP